MGKKRGWGSPHFVSHTGAEIGPEPAGMVGQEEIWGVFAFISLYFLKKVEPLP